ncbi:BZ3500_MvSof-1268-A1-R1_C135g00730 [Microbotryum saponariae]|uniref:BZ3500_MvSof-1268-A1-R1_C135g00730 protein n=1 Tax=Microbotryum saponariae TaxID=289078 RepID=A0A2X0L9X9_9BASI|nr:BZ3500_MvSof-1268-A1-R1_C135g00730 [Microbotryum saponariae]
MAGTRDLTVSKACCSRSFQLTSCEESTLRSAQDLGARSEPGADLGARTWDLGARSEPGPLAQPQARWLWTWGARVSYSQPLEPHTSIAPSHHGQLSRLAFGPRDPSSPESSIGEQIATLQAQLAALQASQPAAAAAAAPPAVTVVPGNAATASKVVFPKHARLDGPKSFTNWLRQLRLALPNQVRGYVLDGVVPPTWTADQLAARDDAAGKSSCLPPSRLRHLATRVMSIAQEIRDAKHRSTTCSPPHVLAMVPSCLDSFRLTFTGRAAKPTRPSRTHDAYGRIRIQLRSAGLSTSHSAMLATSSPCPACALPVTACATAFTCEAPAHGPCRRATRKVTGHSTARTGVNRHVAATTPRTTLDSGATTHMVADRSLFTTYRQTAHTKIGGIAGASRLSAWGTWHSSQDWTPDHAPWCSSHAWPTRQPPSVSRLCDTDRVRLAFTSDGIDIAKDGRAIAHGTRVNDGLLDGFGAGYSDKDVEEFVCNACLGSKATPVVPTPSLTGKRYLVTFLDDHSRKLWAYAIDHKSDVFPTFQTWLAEVELETNARLRILRTDNGGEYRSNAFTEFCKSKGIRRQYSIPYTPQQNGRAERVNLSIVEGVLALLADARLPATFWDEAAAYFVYCKNSKLDPKAARSDLHRFTTSLQSFPFFDHSINKIVLVTTPVDADDTDHPTRLGPPDVHRPDFSTYREPASG